MSIILKGLGGPLLITKGYGLSVGPPPIIVGAWPPAVDPRRTYIIVIALPSPFASVDPRQTHLLPPGPIAVPPPPPPPAGTGSGDPWLGAWLGPWQF